MAPQRSARALPNSALAGAYGGSDETTIVMPAVRRGRRWRRALGVALVLLLLAVGGVGLAAYDNPPLLAPLGATLLGTQPGTVPGNGADPLNILVMGIDQRAHELTRSD